MKVLSIKEPFASLIKNQKKTIETRSWKTNYRGKLYIHSSKRIDPSYKERKDLQKWIIEEELTYGKILCECELVDCILMTEEYIDKIKENNPQEYSFGEYKVGRYAWVLKDIKPLKKEIETNGKLGIWNYQEKKE